MDAGKSKAGVRQALCHQHTAQAPQKRHVEATGTGRGKCSWNGPAPYSRGQRQNFFGHIPN
eukprot:1155849-Pelagomonas_calceolata.AAC.3